MLGPTEVTGGGGADPGLIAAVCAGAVAVGQFVRLTGNPGPEVEPADAYDPTKIPSIGVVVDKPTAVTCSVRNIGSAAIFAGLTTGKVYWLGADGAILATPPPALPGVLRYAQILGYALDPTTLMVDINQVVHGFDR
jgi:hypothetical protein